MKKLLLIPALLTAALCHPGGTKRPEEQVKDALFKNNPSGPANIHQLLVNKQIDPDMALDAPPTRMHMNHQIPLIGIAIQLGLQPIITLLIDAGANAEWVDQKTEAYKKAIALGKQRRYTRTNQMKAISQATGVALLPTIGIEHLIKMIKEYVGFELPDLLPPPTMAEIERVKIEEIG